MSLFEEPEETSSGSGKWVLLVVMVCLAAGAAYLFGPRWVGTDEVTDTSGGPGPASVPSAPVAPEPEPLPRDPEPDPDAEPRPMPVAPTTTPPPVVLLRVTSDVDGADVFIDRKFVGKTPFASSDVTPGPHRVNVSAPGYEGLSASIEIGEVPTTLDTSFRTIRLDHRVAVVHPDRLGGCEGLLIATVDGIRYETDDDDRFVADLDALEEFSIDYLEHTLRLKVRGGRTYDFTDGEPNADKLFVFHREVDQAKGRRGEGSE